MDDSKNRDVDNYDVFLNFRGADTRKVFVSHLNRGLRDAGIHVFFDDQELTFGERLDQELFQAIDNSKIYIPVFSKTYATSKWCLKELARIVKNKEELEDKMILPVFYEVATNDVKLKTNLFINQLSDYKGKESDEDVQEWSKALTCIPERRGWEIPSNSTKGDAVYCQEIISKVLDILKLKHKRLPEGLVGMEDPEKELMELLDLRSSNLRVIGILGIGGIGKTTLANVVYNNICDSFERCCFLSNVRESLEKGNRGCLELQKTLLKDICHQNVDDIRDSSGDGAISAIQRRLAQKTVLLVLDDLSERNQIEMLMGNSYDSFGSGSRIIVTTRNDQAIHLKSEEVKIYEMEEMKKEHALRLFSWHAFREACPPKKFKLFCEDIVVNLTGGIPLCLQVIGSLLYLKREEEWKNTIDKLREIPNKDIQKNLMVSFQDLSYEAKEIFLDIACFFADKKMGYEEYMWEACKFFPWSGIRELESMCLIKIKQDTYWMHDQIKKLGREIVRREGLEDPEQCSRFCRKEQVLDILTRRKKENNNVKAISLLDLDDNVHDFDVYDVDDDVYTTTESECSIYEDTICLRQENLVNLDKLRLFRLSHKDVELNIEGTFEQLLPNLIYLSWHGIPEEHFKVANLCLKKLVILDFSYSTMTESWKGWKKIKGLHSLEVLNLTGCRCLKKTPLFSQYNKLKILILNECDNLEEIDRSIVKLKALKCLYFERCEALKGLPEEVFTLVHLQEMIGNFDAQSQYIRMARIPESIGQLTSIVKLRLQQLQMVTLPDAIGRLYNLQSLDLSYCAKLQSLPDSIGGLVKLECLLLQCCYDLISLPDSLTSLRKLERLDIYDCRKLERLPGSVGEMVLLKEIIVSGSGLKKLPRFIAMQKKLEKLNADYCSQLDGVPYEIAELSCLSDVDLSCTSICGLPSLIHLTCLKTLMLKSCHQLEQLPELPTSLVELFVTSTSLQSVPADLYLSLTNLTKLTVTPTAEEISRYRWSYVEPNDELGVELNVDWVWRIPTLKRLDLRIPDFIITTAPRESFITNTSQLEVLFLRCVVTGTCVIPYSPALTSLFISLYWGTTCLTLSSARLNRLEFFNLSDCRDLAQIHGIGELESLLHLMIQRCSSLERLDDISYLTRLTSLEISECKKLRVIRGLPDLQLLNRLRIHRCESLESIIGLSEWEEDETYFLVQYYGNFTLQHLEILEIVDCPNLVEFPALQGLESLDTLRLIGCSLLDRYFDFSKLRKLRSIRIINCKTQIEITGLEELEFLRYLDIERCHSLQRFNINGLETRLETLKIINCGNLKNIGCTSLDNIDSLRHLKISGCPLLKLELDQDDDDSDDDSDDDCGAPALRDDRYYRRRTRRRVRSFRRVGAFICLLLLVVAYLCAIWETISGSDTMTSLFEKCIVLTICIMIWGRCSTDLGRFRRMSHELMMVNELVREKLASLKADWNRRRARPR